ncbi:MAG: addiction module protein [Anaerolineae bacterium]
MKNRTLTDIKSLSVPERIQMVEDIWDSIACEPESIPLTNAQKEELDRRLTTYYKDERTGSPWVQVKDRILSHS